MEKYAKYLKGLQTKIDKYFEEQKEFIKCKAGCAICCSNSYYPVSELEYSYVKEGLKVVNSEIKELISQKAIDIIKDRKNFLKTNPDVMQYTYQCPFLIDGLCNVYAYRPIICRVHGLVHLDADDLSRMQSPDCVTSGLNYSDIYDSELKKFSKAKTEALGIKTEPKAYDLSYSSVMRNFGGLEFGDIRMIVEWVVMDIPDYQEFIKE